MKALRRLPVLAVVLMCGQIGAAQQPAASLRFGGYDWTVRGAGVGGPGPNHWDPRNVFLDGDGRLHLKITHADGTWRCAELETTTRLGFGRYQFQVVGRIDRLDPNVVLGLFNYPTPDVGRDGTNEIDIEFSRWGNPRWPNGNYTVYPAAAGAKQTSKTFEFKLNGDYTTHRFLWSPAGVAFQSLNGHQDGDANEFENWSFQPATPPRFVPQQPLPVHLNLWLFGGKPPTDGKEVEMVVSSFTFTPGRP